MILVDLFVKGVRGKTFAKLEVFRLWRQNLPLQLGKSWPKKRRGRRSERRSSRRLTRELVGEWITGMTTTNLSLRLVTFVFLTFLWIKYYRTCLLEILCQNFKSSLLLWNFLWKYNGLFVFIFILKFGIFSWNWTPIWWRTESSTTCRTRRRPWRSSSSGRDSTWTSSTASRAWDIRTNGSALSSKNLCVNPLLSFSLSRRLIEELLQSIKFQVLLAKMLTILFLETSFWFI